MFTKLKNYDASSAHLPFHMCKQQATSDEKPQTQIVNIEIRQQEKKELVRWARGVQTHNRLRALVAIQQSPTAQ